MLRRNAALFPGGHVLATIGFIHVLQQSSAAKNIGRVLVEHIPLYLELRKEILSKFWNVVTHFECMIALYPYTGRILKVTKLRLANGILLPFSISCMHPSRPTSNTITTSPGYHLIPPVRRGMRSASIPA